MEEKSEIDKVEVKNRAGHRFKLTGQKPPLQPKHVWGIRSGLQLNNKVARFGIVQPRNR